MHKSLYLYLQEYMLDYHHYLRLFLIKLSIYYISTKFIKREGLIFNVTLLKNNYPKQ